MRLFGRLALVVGLAVFLWFFSLMVIKWLYNVGSFFGMVIGLLCFLYGWFQKPFHSRLVEAWQHMWGRIGVCFAGIVFMGCIFFAVAAGASIIGAPSKHIPKNTPVIVLGCAVKGTRPSRILQTRIAAAYQYLMDNPQAIGILSGGKGDGEDVSEAKCMYRALTDAGIEADRLYMEDRSVNTQKNLKNSEKLLSDRGMSGAVTIITSDFHLYRGMHWAKEQGFQTYGYAAKTPGIYYPTFFLREVAALARLWTAGV